MQFTKSRASLLIVKHFSKLRIREKLIFLGQNKFNIFLELMYISTY